MVLEDWKERFDFVKQLPETEQRYFLQSVSARSVEAGEVLSQNHSTHLGIIFVLTGQLRVYNTSKSGRELSLYTVCAGEADISSASLARVCGTVIPSMSIAAVQEGQIAVMSSSAFRYLYSVSPGMQDFIACCVLRKFYTVVSHLEGMTFQNVEDRLYTYIVETTDHGRMPIYATHAQLAAQVGTSREVVTRRLREMSQKGIIRVERGKVTFLPK